MIVRLFYILHCFVVSADFTRLYAIHAKPAATSKHNPIIIFSIIFIAFFTLLAYLIAREGAVRIKKLAVNIL